MSGLLLILTFVVAIIIMVVAISKYRIHPFFAIMGVSLVLALVSEIKLSEIADIIGNGFSQTFSSIGIVIILGTFIGTVLETTGAALRLADIVIKLIGKNKPEVAIALMGWVVAIPVFCDSGFVILNPIRKALSRHSGNDSVAMTVALSAGLYISHVFIPPTPGPIAAANTLGIGDNLLLVMGLGVLCSVLPLTAGIVFAKFICRRVKGNEEKTSDEILKSYEELFSDRSKIPGGFSAVLPLIVPVIFMSAGTISSVVGTDGFFGELFAFTGKPVIALTLGTIFAIVQLKTSKKYSEFYKLTENTLKTAGPILFVTAAGGVLGKVVSSTTLVDYIVENAGFLMNMGIVFPFLIAAILKTSLGSSTVAITTTAGIVAPLLKSMGFVTDISCALVVMAIGSGAMTVSHANDSYFWVVTNFGNMTSKKGYKTQTVMSLCTGVAALTGIMIISFILKLF